MKFRIVGVDTEEMRDGTAGVLIVERVDEYCDKAALRLVEAQRFS